MSKLTYVHKVICHSGHDLSRFMIVVKAVGKLFKMLEHVASHLCLHTYAHYVAVILDEIVEKHTYGVKSEEYHAENNNEIILFVGDEIVKHVSCYYRINETDKSNKKGSQHIHCENEFVRLVVFEESFKHFSLLLVFVIKKPTCLSMSVGARNGT